MAFFLAASLVVAAGTAAYGASENNQSKQAAKEAARRQNSITKQEAAQAEADLFEQARAAQMERDQIAGRLLLEDRQRAEARRQGDQEGVEFTLGESFAERKASVGRRETFFDFGAGA